MKRFFLDTTPGQVITSVVLAYVVLTWGLLWPLTQW